MFVRQGKFADDPKIVAVHPGAPNLTIDHIGDLLDYKLSDLLGTTLKERGHEEDPTATRDFEVAHTLPLRWPTIPELEGAQSVTESPQTTDPADRKTINTL